MFKVGLLWEKKETPSLHPDLWMQVEVNAKQRLQ